MKRRGLLPLFFLCFSCGHMPAIRYYLLDVPQPQTVAAKKNVTLWLKEVSADAVHVQDRMIYRTSAFEIQFDPYRRWALTPTEMVKQATLDYLRQAGLFSRVSDRLTVMDQPFRSLSLKLGKFEEYSTAAKRCARVALHAQVSEGREEKLLWEGDLDAEVNIQGADSQAIVSAMSLALEKTLQQLTDKLVIL